MFLKPLPLPGSWLPTQQAHHVSPKWFTQYGEVRIITLKLICMETCVKQYDIWMAIGNTAYSFLSWYHHVLWHSGKIHSQLAGSGSSPSHSP